MDLDLHHPPDPMYHDGDGPQNVQLTDLSNGGGAPTSTQKVHQWYSMHQHSAHLQQQLPQDSGVQSMENSKVGGFESILNIQMHTYRFLFELTKNVQILTYFCFKAQKYADTYLFLLNRSKINTSGTLDSLG
jgi:hypothetical protein